MKEIQKEITLQYNGYLNTPTLWKGELEGLNQLSLNSVESHQFLTNEPLEKRLGKRVERFVTKELQQHQDVKVLAENIQINDNKITIGELDAIISNNQQSVHLEIVYKFYLYDKSVGTSELDHWIGPNRNDSLVQKLTKLKEKQLPLLYKEQTKTQLTRLDFDVTAMIQQVYFKAQLFLPYSNEAINNYPFINNNCIKGYYIKYSNLNCFKTNYFYLPSKLNWLIDVHENVVWKSFDNIQNEIDLLIEQQLSPLCWIKQPNGELHKMFIVWW